MTDPTAADRMRAARYLLDHIDAALGVYRFGGLNDPDDGIEVGDEVPVECELVPA